MDFGHFPAANILLVTLEIKFVEIKFVDLEENWKCSGRLGSSENMTKRVHYSTVRRFSMSDFQIKSTY